MAENGFDGYGYGINTTVYTDGTYTYNNLRGAVFTAYTTSTATSGQDGLIGSFNQAYNSSSGTVTNAYGSFSTVFTNNASANITNAYGVLGYTSEAVPGSIGTGYGGYFYSQDATTNFGVYAQALADDAATFANIYAGYFSAYPNNASTTITTAYGISARASEAAGNIITAYAGYFAAPSATS